MFESANSLISLLRSLLLSESLGAARLTFAAYDARWVASSTRNDPYEIQQTQLVVGAHQRFPRYWSLGAAGSCHVAGLGGSWCSRCYNPQDSCGFEYSKLAAKYYLLVLSSKLPLLESGWLSTDNTSVSWVDPWVQWKWKPFGNLV